MRLTPASRHMSTWRLAWSTSVEPTLAKSPRPPNVIVPRVSAETRRPELAELAIFHGRPYEPGAGGMPRASSR